MQADTTKKKKDIEKKANELEKKSRRKKIGETSALVHKHHSAGMAMTFLQVAIVLASVSSLLRKKFFVVWKHGYSRSRINLFVSITLQIAFACQKPKDTLPWAFFLCSMERDYEVMNVGFY